MNYSEAELKDIQYEWQQYYINNCNKCHGMGTLNDVVCICTKQANAAFLCETNGFGKRYLKMSLMDSHLKQVISQYFSDFPKYKENGIGLYLFGKYGTGKTLAVTNLAKNIMMIENPLMTSSFSEKFFLYDDLVRLSLEDTSYSSLEMIIKKPDILVLDNIGNEIGLRTQARSSVSLLENIIRNRMIMGKVTWITTNLSLDDFSNLYSVSLAQIIQRDYQLLCSN